MLKRQQAGDTIIEVLFATTVFTLIAVSALSIMNQGIAMAQRSLEIGLVRQQIDAQADALRFLNQAYVADYGKRDAATAKWNQIITENAVTRAQDFDAMVVDGHCQMPSPSGNPFALDITKLGTNPKLVPVTDAVTYAKVRYDASPTTAEGIWVQAVRSPSTPDNKPGFYDFHIRACWHSPGQEAPVTLGTIVRLYEPRG
jgi:type II secretory pathway pseudopilin PulG